MPEDIIRTLRMRAARGSGKGGRKRGRAFMSPTEFKRIRMEVIGTPQKGLSAVMISPYTGRSIDHTQISKWEHGTLCIPLWAARSIQALAARAKQYDEKE